MVANERELAKQNMANKIAGEIVLAEKPGDAIRKWRNIFKVSQRGLAEVMKVMPSVISDYEGGRRASPGVKMIRKIVVVLIALDEKNGGPIIKEFTNMYETDLLNDAILDIKEFPHSRKIDDFIKATRGKLVVGEEQKDKTIYGYTIIDSFKAITELSPVELVRLYGLTTERAMVFTRIHHGRSPLIAIKVTNLKPGVIVLQGLKSPKEFDKLAQRIAEVEKIPVVISGLQSDEELVKNLRTL